MLRIRFEFGAGGSFLIVMLVRYKGFLWRCGRMGVQAVIFSSDYVFIMEVIDLITTLSSMMSTLQLLGY